MCGCLPTSARTDGGALPSDGKLTLAPAASEGRPGRVDLRVPDLSGAAHSQRTASMSALRRSERRSPKPALGKLKPSLRDDPNCSVIATDPDSAGWQSAQQAFWRLA